MSADYYIDIVERVLTDGRTIYGVTVGQNMEKAAVEAGDGLGSVYFPADTHEETVSNVRRIIERYRDPDERQDDRPAPTADNTELRDETGEFSMAEFYDRGTLAAYLQEGET